MNLKSAKSIVITRPDGTEVEYPSQSAAARGEPRITQSALSQLCRQPHGKKTNGYQARWGTLEGVSSKAPDAALPPSDGVGHVSDSHA